MRNISHSELGNSFDSSYLFVFTDESRGGGASWWDIEVLASVPKDSELPDNFGSNNLKISEFKKEFNKRGYPRKSAWQNLFRSARIYIYDPSPAIGSLRADGESREFILSTGANPARYFESQLAWQASWMNPFAAMRSVDIEMGGYSVPAFGFKEEYDTVLALFRETESRKKGKPKYSNINARRRLLISWAINHELLKGLPYRYDQNGDLIRVHREVSKFSFDVVHARHLIHDGFPGDEPLYAAHRASLYKYLQSIISHTQDDIELGVVKSGNSIQNEAIQAAGICAGYARDIYIERTFEHKRTELPQIFREVFINGRFI